jgi:hypothetical protein
MSGLHGLFHVAVAEQLKEHHHAHQAQLEDRGDDSLLPGRQDRGTRSEEKFESRSEGIGILHGRGLGKSDADSDRCCVER